MPSREDAPDFADLPVSADAPPGASWGVFGEDDEIGTLNFAGAAEVRGAATLVQRGVVFSLNLELNALEPGLFHRGAARHRLWNWRVGEGVSQDDVLEDLWLQGSSQWDALRHFAERPDAFYGGRSLAQVASAGDGLLGIDRWARRGIAGRGVLVDVEGHLRAAGRDYDPLTPFVIDPPLLSAALSAQGAELRRGDILLVRTGWLERVLRLSPEQRAELNSDRAPASAGLGGSDLPAFLWNHRLAAVAADNPALEPVPSESFALHRDLIARLGMAVGELWFLDDLAEDCRRDGRYEGLLTSAPLNLAGGAGSPANSLLLK